MRERWRREEGEGGGGGRRGREREGGREREEREEERVTDVLNDPQYMFPLSSVVSTRTERLQWQLLSTWPKPLPIRAQLQSRDQRSSSTTLVTTVWTRVWSMW